jgi:hypothetical protein
LTGENNEIVSPNAGIVGAKRNLCGIVLVQSQSDRKHDMPNFILTRSSVILCPHGGVVTHGPMKLKTERVNGALPLLLSDQYYVAGCPNPTPGPPLRITWVAASTTRPIEGVPVLTNASVGLCQSVSGIGQGTAIIGLCQTVETD